MKRVVKFIPYYWIIQGLIIAISIQGMGYLPIVGGLLLIIVTILYKKSNARYTLGFSIWYIIYSILFMLSTFIVLIFFDSSFIHLLLFIVGILNIALSCIQLKYRERLP